MKRLLLLALALLFPVLVEAGASKPATTLRLHFEVGTTAAQGSKTTLRVQLPQPPVAVYVSKYADLSERNLVRAEVYPALPGSVMLTFDAEGKRKLNALTAVSRGMRLVVFLNGFVIFCPQVDATLPNGKLLIPSGISDNNLLALQAVAKRNAKR